MEDLSRFCCLNSACPDYGKRGAGNVAPRGFYGPGKSRRLLAFGQREVAWGCVDSFLLQLPELSGQRRLLFLECLNTSAQLIILVKFKNSSSDDGNERRPNNRFLQCSHSNGFGGGDGR